MRTHLLQTSFLLMILFHLISINKLNEIHSPTQSSLASTYLQNFNSNPSFQQSRNYLKNKAFSISKIDWVQSKTSQKTGEYEMDWILVIVLSLTGLHMHRLSSPASCRLIYRVRLKIINFMWNKMIMKDAISQWLNSILWQASQK